MFKSACIFRIPADFTLPALDLLEQALQAAQFVSCGPTQPESCGWIAPRGKKSTVLAEAVAGGVILRLQTERRTVPASALADAVDEMVQKYKDETGRDRVGAKIKKEFKEEAMQTLLPRAFPARSAYTLWLDPVGHFLVLDTSSTASIDQAVTRLIDALGASLGCGLKVTPVQTEMSAATAMSLWLSSSEAPPGFTVDRDCELKTPDDRKTAVRYSSHTLEIVEVAAHIAAGKVPTQLALTWNDRVSFVLTDTALVKKIKLLDVEIDDQDDTDDDGFDADAAIVTGELAALIPDLLGALGGELAVAA